MKLESTHTGQTVLTHGIGAGNYTEREEGLFEVRSAGGVKEFGTFLNAFICYYRKSEDASLWDVTEKPCLIEGKTIL